MKKNRFSLAMIGLLVILSLASNAILATEPPAKKHKQTVLGKYASAGEAYERWRANPECINVLDVRTIAEYVYVGHAPMARNIPYKLLSREWDSSRKRYNSGINPGFVSEVRKLFSPKDTIFVMCRSGGRSADAVDALAGAEFINAYTVVDGFEGDKVTDPDSKLYGKRVINGWKNYEAPWTYKLDPDLVYRKSPEK